MFIRILQKSNKVMGTQKRKNVCIIEDAAGIKRSFGSFKRICDTYLFEYEKHKRKKLPIEIDGFKIYRLTFEEKHLMDLEHIGGVVLGVLRENIQEVNSNDVSNFKIAYRASEKEWKIRVVLCNGNWVSHDSIPDLEKSISLINSSIGSTFRLKDKHCFEDDGRNTEIMYTLIS